MKIPTYHGTNFKADSGRFRHNFYKIINIICGLVVWFDKLKKQATCNVYILISYASYSICMGHKTTANVHWNQGSLRIIWNSVKYTYENLWRTLRMITSPPNFQRNASVNKFKYFYASLRTQFLLKNLNIYHWDPKCSNSKSIIYNYNWWWVWLVGTIS